MAISKKRLIFIDELFVDMNASAAYIRAGYSPKGARQSAYKLLQNPEVKAEVARRMKESRMTADEVITGLELMALGTAPTKLVTGSHAREEYDLLAAHDKMGKIYALFVDKLDVTVMGLEIIDDDEKD